MLGSMRTFRVVIENFDVTDAVIGCDIFQSILEPTWTAQVFFQDSADLMSTIPIVSGSKIKIMIETKHGVETDAKKEFQFVIYRIGDKNMQNQKNMMYTAYCASKEFVTNLTTRISRNFKNTKMTDAMRQVCGDVFPDANIVATSCDNNANLIIPNWTPFNSLGWMMKMAHSGGVADYLFYQTEDTEYTVDTINNLFKKSASPSVLRVRPSNINPELNDVYNIIKYQYEYGDASANLATGYYGNTLKSFDFRTKTMDVNVYKTSQQKNWSSAFDDASNSKVSFKAKSKGVNGDAGSPADDANIWMQSRLASLLAIEQIRLLAQTSGSVGTYKWLGKCINVDVPNQSTLNEMPNDIRSKGSYLVRAVVHHIDRQTYTNNFELVKRSFS